MNSLPVEILSLILAEVPDVFVPCLKLVSKLWSEITTRPISSFILFVKGLLIQRSTELLAHVFKVTNKEIKDLFKIIDDIEPVFSQGNDPNSFANNHYIRHYIFELMVDNENINIIEQLYKLAQPINVTDLCIAAISRDVEIVQVAIKYYSSKTVPQDIHSAIMAMSNVRTMIGFDLDNNSIDNFNNIRGNDTEEIMNIFIPLLKQQTINTEILFYNGSFDILKALPDDLFERSYIPARSRSSFITNSLPYRMSAAFLQWTITRIPTYNSPNILLDILSNGRIDLIPSICEIYGWSTEKYWHKEYSRDIGRYVDGFLTTIQNTTPENIIFIRLLLIKYNIDHLLEHTDYSIRNDPTFLKHISTCQINLMVIREKVISLSRQ